VERDGLGVRALLAARVGHLAEALQRAGAVADLLLDGQGPLADLEGALDLPVRALDAAQAVQCAAEVAALAGLLEGAHRLLELARGGGEAALREVEVGRFLEEEALEAVVAGRAREGQAFL